MCRQLTLLLTAGCLLLLPTCIGCQPTAENAAQTDDYGHEHDHEHGDRPASFSAAIARLKEMREAIGSAMDNDDPDAAHDALHDIGSLLDAIPELAADTDLAESQWLEVKEASEQIMQAFGDIDDAMHEPEGDVQATYDAQKSTIDAGIAELEAKLHLLGDDASGSEAHQEHGAEDVE